MKINDIKNKDLVYFGERIEPYFASSIIIRGMVDKENIKNVLKWKSGVRWLQTNNYFFVKKDDLAKAQNELEKRFKENGVSYAKGLIDKCFDFGKRLIKISKEIEKKYRSGNIRRDKMHELLKKYIEAGSNYMIFQNIALFEDTISKLAHELANRYSKTNTEADKLLNLITTANRLTAVEKEQDDFLRIVEFKGDGKLLSRHAKKYGWLSIRFFVGEPWNKADIIKRLRKNDNIKAKKELSQRIEYREDREKQIKKAVKNFSQKDEKAVELIRDIVYLRTQRTDFFQESSFYVQDLVKKIAGELSVSYDDLLYLSAQEVLLSLEGKFNYFECIERRKAGFLVFFDYDKDIVLEAKDVSRYIEKRPILNREAKGTTRLTGKAAFKGKAVGKVRIVKSEKDNAKFKRNDILVSIMTTSNLIPAMKLASAFVTDEGGITCHAAIIAREMKKPCIIGTKIATKVLHDGDLVEVDADKEIVRILKR